MNTPPLYRTRRRIVVRLGAKLITPTFAKAEAYRFPTGGYHGLLLLRNLKPVPRSEAERLWKEAAR